MNFTQVLGRLLRFTADVATAIRLYSAYNQANIDDIKQFAPEDILWLSDCLHNFGLLGDAVSGGNVEQINFACDMLTNAYRDYSIDSQNYRLSRPSFERNANRFSLQEGIEIFEAIRRKADKPPAVLSTIKNPDILIFG